LFARDTVIANVVGKDPAYLLTLSSWEMVAAISEAVTVFDGDGIASTDLYAQMPTCKRDDIYNFQRKYLLL
jgi:hypothetical protein